MLKKTIVHGSEAPRASGCPDAQLLQTVPQVCEYLTQSKWDDGSPRLTSTVMVCMEEGTVKVCLNDRANERSLWRSGQTLGEALKALEAALEADSNDWRRWNSKVRTKRG